MIRSGRCGIANGRAYQRIDPKWQRQSPTGQRESLLIGQQQSQIGTGVVIGGEKWQSVQMTLGCGQLQGERCFAAIRATGQHRQAAQRQPQGSQFHGAVSGQGSQEKGMEASYKM